jgi:hypothetical protein
MWDILKDLNTFQRSVDFCLGMLGFCKDYKAFKRHFQLNGGFFLNNVRIL